MTGIPTWHERAMAHPDHQSGMISEGMIRARMGEEIADLRAEVERLRAFEAAHRQLQAALDTATRERDEARAEVGRMKKLHPPLADLPWPPREEAKP